MTNPIFRKTNEVIEAPGGLPFLPCGPGTGPDQSTTGPFANAFDPAVSEAQRKLMAIAEHHPSEVQKANRGVLSMSKAQLHDFAATKGLTKEHVSKKGK